MKEMVFMFLIVLSLSLVVQAKERTLEDAMANSKTFLEKAGKFQKDFDKEEKTDNYPTTSKGVALAFCSAFADFDIDQMLIYFEKDTKKRSKKELLEMKNSPNFSEFMNTVFEADIKCEITSIIDKKEGYKRYIFKSVDVLDPIDVDKVDGRFVVVDSKYIINKREKAKTKNSNDFIGKAEKFMQEDYKKIKEVKAYYPSTSDKLAIAACEAFKNMDWETLYRYTATSYHDKLKEQIKYIEINKEEFKKDFSRCTCKINSSNKIGKLKMKYYFNVLGAIYVEFLPEFGNGWQVIRF